MPGLLPESAGELKNSDNNLDYGSYKDSDIYFGPAYDFKFGLILGATFESGVTQFLYEDYQKWVKARNSLLRFTVGYIL